MRTELMLIDDDIGGRKLLAGFLEKQGFAVHQFADAESALERFTKRGFDLALVDVKLPGMSGIDLTSKLLAIDPTFPIILVTAYGNIDTAVAGMKAGATDYLIKPVDLEELKLTIARNLEKRRTEDEITILREQLEPNIIDDFVAESPAMKEILSSVSRVAPTDAPVLITGESGVGKECIAKIIHNASGRKGMFVPINCSAIPETLIESELFGAEPGAYTGANKRMRGKVELADRGTLFLDEVAELPIHLQPKILRFLQEGKFFRLGGDAEVAPSVRILSATNRDVRALVQSGKMREDLYFRLAVINIEIPPLRDRREDLKALAERFTIQFSHKHGKPISGLSREALDAIFRHSWSGNVRELANTIERAVILARGELLSPEDLRIIHPSSEYFSEKLADVEREHIIKILKSVGWHMNRAAEKLGVHRNTLRNKIKEYGIEEKSP